MKELPLFRDLLLNGQRVSDWSYRELSHNLRLFYKPLDPVERQGFEFYAARFVSSDLRDYSDWREGETTAECAFHGVAYFDGVRHLYMGDQQTDNVGYLNYPDTSEMIELFEALRALEQTYCDGV